VEIKDQNESLAVLKSCACKIDRIVLNSVIENAQAFFDF
jgi:hypothetical protein